MGIISIDSTAMMKYHCTKAADSGTERATKTKQTTRTLFSPKSTTATTNTNTSNRTMRRPRSESNSSCDSSVDSCTKLPTRRSAKNIKQYHHNYSYNNNSGSSSGSRKSGGKKPSSRRKTNFNKNQARNPKHHHNEEVNRDRYVAMDCEMVGIGLDGRQSMVARVTIIDWECKVLLDTFVKPTSDVTDYRTFVSGIVPENLVQEEEQEEQEEGSCSDSCCSSSNSSSSNSNLNDVSLVDIESCRQKVLDILKDKVLVGHALKNDLHVLNITHPWYDTRDTAKYEPFMKVRFDDGILWPRKLKDLVNEKLKYEIQISGRPHSAYEDAKAALDVYRCAQYKWEKAMEYKINKTKQIMERKQQQQIKQ